MTDREQEIAARCEAATPGPWIVGDGTDATFYCGDEAAVAPNNKVIVGRTLYGDDGDIELKANIRFCAHAREDVPHLQGVIDGLRAELSLNKSLLQRYLDTGMTASSVETMKAELEAAQRREKAAENDMAQMLKVMPVSICKKFCRNASAHCAGWCECSPKWRGPVAENRLEGGPTPDEAPRL